MLHNLLLLQTASFLYCSSGRKRGKTSQRFIHFRIRSLFICAVVCFREYLFRQQYLSFSEPNINLSIGSELRSF